MESITMKLPPGRESDRRIVRFWGERRLHDFADTGVFTISTAASDTCPHDTPHKRGGNETLANLLIEVNGRLDLADSECGGDPYERDEFSRRRISS